MKNIVKAGMLLIFGLTLCLNFAFAQPSLQWGKRGGSFSSLSGTSEYVISTETDQNGNVYIVSTNASGVYTDIDGEPGLSIYDLATIASWNCNGELRWKKNIGTAASGNIRGMGIDSMGSIYVGGILRSHNPTKYGYLDTDTVLGYDIKSIYIVKYDSSGHLQWLRRPAPAGFDITTGTNGIYSIIDLQVAPSGLSYVFCYLPAGNYVEEGFELAEKGYYLLRYTSSGDFHSVVRLDIHTTNGGRETNIDGQANLFFGKFGVNFADESSYLYNQYVDLYGTVEIGTTTIEGNIAENAAPVYLAAFNADGSNLWVKQSSSTGYIINRYCRPAVDEEGNIYITGDAVPTGGNEFAGHVFSNPEVSYLPQPFIIKLDASGNLKWATAAACNNLAIGSALSYKNSAVWCTGTYTQKLKWGSHELETAAGADGGHMPFVVKLHAPDGSVLLLDSIAGTSTFHEPSALTVDYNNNAYIGGLFTETLFVGNDTINSSGGTNDWFVAKYGYDNCDCTIPNPDFTFNSIDGSLTLEFEYSGTTPFSSISWDFGDGTPASSEFSPIHSFTEINDVYVCVTVTNDCGSNTKCKNIGSGMLSTESLLAPSMAFNIYPNPASDQLMITEVPFDMDIIITNVKGIKVQQNYLQKGSNRIDISSLPPGFYLVQSILPNGTKNRTKFVKL
jgi:hypothetical protein